MPGWTAVGDPSRRPALRMSAGTGACRRRAHGGRPLGRGVRLRRPRARRDRRCRRARRSPPGGAAWDRRSSTDSTATSRSSSPMRAAASSPARSRRVRTRCGARRDGDAVVARDALDAPRRRSRRRPAVRGLPPRARVRARGRERVRRRARARAGCGHHVPRRRDAPDRRRPRRPRSRTTPTRPTGRSSCTSCCSPRSRPAPGPRASTRCSSAASTPRSWPRCSSASATACTRTRSGSRTARSSNGTSTSSRSSCAPSHTWVPITSDVIGAGLAEFADVYSLPVSQPHYLLHTLAAARAARADGFDRVFTGDGCDAALPRVPHRAPAGHGRRVDDTGPGPGGARGAPALEPGVVRAPRRPRLADGPGPARRGRGAGVASAGTCRSRSSARRRGARLRTGPAAGGGDPGRGDPRPSRRGCRRPRSGPARVPRARPHRPERAPRSTARSRPPASRSGRRTSRRRCGRSRCRCRPRRCARPTAPPGWARTCWCA